MADITCVGWTARFGILCGIESDGPGMDMLGMRQTVAFGILCGIECDGSDMDVLGTGQTVAFGILYGIECDGSGVEARGNKRILGDSASFDGRHPMLLWTVPQGQRRRRAEKNLPSGPQ